MKFHDQDVGEPVEVSVNWTAWPSTGAAGETEKAATTLEAPETKTVLVALEDEAALEAVKVTVYEPAAANAWDGFRSVLVDPSPKFQAQEAGLPVDASVNWTV